MVGLTAVFVKESCNHEARRMSKVFKCLWFCSRRNEKTPDGDIYMESWTGTASLNEGQPIVYVYFLIWFYIAEYEVVWISY